MRNHAIEITFSHIFCPYFNSIPSIGRLGVFGILIRIINQAPNRRPDEKTGEHEERMAL
jgi:hypothetical protein